MENNSKKISVAEPRRFGDRNLTKARDSDAHLAMRQREQPGSKNRQITHGRLDNSQQLSSLSWGRGPFL